MRSVLTFACESETLLGTLDKADDPTGMLIVTGGRQTRIGPHRIMAALAGALAASGYPVFRYDRRGVGDSSGGDNGFLDSKADMAAAIRAFRSAQPQVTRIWGLGLCDGATALALLHSHVSIDGLILLNPWVVEAEGGSPPPAAVRAHYREQILTWAGWHKLLTRGFDIRAFVRGIKTALRKEDQTLARDVMASLTAFRGPISILLAERDATARAFLDQYHGKAGISLRGSPRVKLAALDSASHSFADREDRAWLRERILEAIVGDG